MGERCGCLREGGRGGDGEDHFYKHLGGKINRAGFGVKGITADSGVLNLHEGVHGGREMGLGQNRLPVQLGHIECEVLLRHPSGEELVGSGVRSASR